MWQRAATQKSNLWPPRGRAILATNMAFVGRVDYRFVIASEARLWRNRAHLDLRPGAHLGERFHVADGLCPHVARAREPRFVRFRDRGAAIAYGDGVAVRPVGDLTRGDDRARVPFAANLDRDVEVDLLAPGQRRSGDRQRRGDRLG